MRNSMGEKIPVCRETKKDWMKSVSFTPLQGEKFKCNECGVKVKKNWTDSHESLHMPKKVEDQVTNINRKIDVIFEEIKNLKDNAKSESNFDNLLDKANVKARINNILKRVAYLSKEDKLKLEFSNLQHLQQYK